MPSKQVAVIMGSDSDMPVMQDALAVLKKFGVGFEVRVLSAHRTPQQVAEFIAAAEKNGVQVFIAGAGCAAHLAGTIAAYTIRPVIGVPLDASPLNGLDALLATVQMPAGVPVATVAIGKSGAQRGIACHTVPCTGRYRACGKSAYV